MELVDLSHYAEIKGAGFVPPFSDLRQMKQILLTQDLKLVNTEDNLAYVTQLADRGVQVASVSRIPLTLEYINRTDFPRRILFEMTNKCNVLCWMCPRQEITRLGVNMDKEVYKRVIDEIDSRGVEYLAIHHIGEALMHPDFCDLIDYISGKGNLGMVWMSTNGHTFGEDKIRFVLDSGIDFLNFSAHAITEETYKKVVPNGNFSLVQKNLEIFYRLKAEKGLFKKPFLHCQMIEQEGTRHEVDAFIAAHYKRAEITSVHMLEYAFLSNNSFGYEQRHRKERGTCYRLKRNDCCILSNGEVIPCATAADGEIRVGNVHEKSLHEIWTSKERRDLLDLNDQGRIQEIEFCAQCSDYDL